MENNTPAKRGRPPGQKKTALDIIKKPNDIYLPTNAQLPEGDNNKFTTFALAIMQMPKIDPKDPKQVQDRVLEYFHLCADNDMKPGVTSVALALGMDRRRLWEINTDQPNQLHIPQESKEIIKQVYTSLELLWETYMLNGKINPVSGIFLGKNNFGYKDQQEYVLTPNQMGETISQEALEAKYNELPED